MDFGHNDPARQRLEQEPYWKQYGWMNKLGLNGPRAIVFASSSSATAPTTPPATASPRNTLLRLSMRGAPLAVAPARAASPASSRHLTSLPPRGSSAPSWMRTGSP